MCDFNCCFLVVCCSVGFFNIFSEWVGMKWIIFFVLGWWLFFFECCRKCDIFLVLLICMMVFIGLKFIFKFRLEV